MRFGNRPGMPTGSVAGDHADAAQQVVSGLADIIVRPGEAIDLRGVSRARVFLLAGDHGGLRVDSDGTVIECAPGAAFTRHVQINADCEFVNCDFLWQRGSNTDDTLVTVAATATVRFTNCRFYRAKFIAPTCVTIANGGKAHFVNCWFGPEVGVAGSVISNAGIAANVSVIGSNKTTQGIGTVVSLAVTT